MLTPKCSGKIQSLIFLRSTNKGLTYHSSHEDQSLTSMHTFTRAGSRPWEQGGEGGGAVKKKIFFRPFGPQFGLNIRMRAGPPGPSPGSATVYHPASRAFLSLLEKEEKICPFTKSLQIKNYRHFVISVKGLVFPVWKRFEVNLVFSRQTGLFQWEYPLIDQPNGHSVEFAVPSARLLGLGSKLYPSEGARLHA